MSIEQKLLTRGEYEEWIRGMEPNYCAFCDWQKNQLLLVEGRAWLWIASRAPYWRYHTMLIPKRHIVEFNELTVIEMGEFVEMYESAVATLRSADLHNPDGSPIKKYIFFWRLRDDPVDHLSGNLRPGHLHVHVTPDRDHLFDPLLDEEAVRTDFSPLLRHLSKPEPPSQ